MEVQDERHDYQTDPAQIPTALLLTWYEMAPWEAVSVTTVEAAAPGSVRLTTPRCTGCAHRPKR